MGGPRRARGDTGAQATQLHAGGTLEPRLRAPLRGPAQGCLACGCGGFPGSRVDMCVRFNGSIVFQDHPPPGPCQDICFVKCGRQVALCPTPFLSDARAQSPGPRTEAPVRLGGGAAGGRKLGSQATRGGGRAGSGSRQGPSRARHPVSRWREATRSSRWRSGSVGSKDPPVPMWARPLWTDTHAFCSPACDGAGPLAAAGSWARASQLGCCFASGFRPRWDLLDRTRGRKDDERRGPGAQHGGFSAGGAQPLHRGAPLASGLPGQPQTAHLASRWPHAACAVSGAPGEGRGPGGRVACPWG